MLENMNMKPISIFSALALATILVACPPPTIVVGITPNTQQSLGSGQKVNLSAVVSNASNTAVTWTLTPEVGSLSSPTGNAIQYSAPASVTEDSSVTVTAKSVQDPSKQASLSILLKKPSIVVEPANAALLAQAGTGSVIRSVAVATQVQFKATIQNSADQRVTWSVAEAATATPNTKFGIVDTNGNYTSPAEVPSPAIATRRCCRCQRV